MSANAATEGAAKLAVIFKPMLDEVKKELKDHVTAGTQEVLIAIAKLEGRVDVLEKLVGEKKKTTTRGEKKTAGVDANAANPGAVGEIQLQQPTGTTKNFPVNKLVYFRDHFKTNADYRAKYVSEDVKKLMDADPTITGKTNESQKLIAQATFCWNYFKTNKTDVAAAIEKEYQEAKAAHELANKPPQQTVEANTPPAQ